MKLIFVALLTGATCVTTAAGAKDFPNFRVEANAGWDHVRGRLAYRDSALPDNDFTYDETTNGLTFGGTVGVDYEAFPGVYLGLEGGIDIISNKRCTAVYGNDAACFKAKRNLFAGARLGVPVDKATLFFVGLAYVNGRGTASYRDADGKFSISDNRDGMRVSGGIERRLSGPVFGKLEYRYLNYSDYSISAGSEKLSLGFDRHQLVAGVGVRF